MLLVSIGYRATARAMEIVVSMLLGGKHPSANGCQFWLLRLGLYELQRPKEQADDWVWIIDHTVQTGNGKCLVVVGVRLSHWESLRRQALTEDAEASFALSQQDLTAFAIERVDSSSAEVVEKQLKELSKQTGIQPCCLLADQGADVRKGIELFCQAQKGQTNGRTIGIFDIAHAAANAVKRQLANDPEWQRFVSDANGCKKHLRQTAYAFLLPPDLKTKARWMNLEPLLAWSGRVLEFLKDPQPRLVQAEAPLDAVKLKQKIGWIRPHADSLNRWSRMLEASATALKYIRNEGYHKGAYEELRRQLTPFAEGPARSVADEVLEFVREQSERAGERRVLGSTEVLESLIGHGKQIMHRTTDGYTKSVLGIAAAVVNWSCATVSAAFEQVKVNDVAAWVHKNLGLSLSAQRRRALTPPPPP